MDSNTEMHIDVSRGRGLGMAGLWAALVAMALTVALGLAEPAFGAEDPVAKGALKLKVSPAFDAELKSDGVRMTPKAFSIEGGSIDPMTGTGSLELKGRLRFRSGANKVVFKRVTARLGTQGVLKAGGVRLFRLRGRAVQRNGFGAEIKGVNAKLTSSGARKLNSRLGLHSLHSMRAAEVSVSEQPQTVEATGGNVHLVPDPTLTPGSGTLASKLLAHCVNFVSGNTAIAPGVKAGPTDAPFYDFPVSGGTISPFGTDGIVNQSGGIQVRNNQPSSMSNPCHNSVPATLSQTDFANNLLDNHVSSHVVITGLVPTAGDQGVRIGRNLDPSGATVSADPVNHTVMIRGLTSRLNKAAALILNQTFPQPQSSFDASDEFAPGDLFGTIDLAVTTR